MVARRARRGRLLLVYVVQTTSNHRDFISVAELTLRLVNLLSGHDEAIDRRCLSELAEAAAASTSSGNRQILNQLAYGLITIVRTFRHRPRYHSPYGGGQIISLFEHRRRRLLHVLHHDCCWRRTSERHVSHQHFVNDHAKGVDVRARIDVGRLRALLRRHVLRRADYKIRRGESGIVVPVVLLNLGDSEIENLGVVRPVRQPAT